MLARFQIATVEREFIVGDAPCATYRVTEGREPGWYRGEPGHLAATTTRPAQFWRPGSTFRRWFCLFSSFVCFVCTLFHPCLVCPSSLSISCELLHARPRVRTASGRVLTSPALQFTLLIARWCIKLTYICIYYTPLPQPSPSPPLAASTHSAQLQTRIYPHSIPNVHRSNKPGQRPAASCQRQS